MARGSKETIADSMDCSLEVTKAEVDPISYSSAETGRQPAATLWALWDSGQCPPAHQSITLLHERQHDGGIQPQAAGHHPTASGCCQEMLMGRSRYLMQSPVLHYLKVKSSLSAGGADLFGNV